MNLKIRDNGKLIRKQLYPLGVKNIEAYDLCTNYGYTFEFNHNCYDLRRWLVENNKDVNYWRLTSLDHSFEIKGATLAYILTEFKKFISRSNEFVDTAEEFKIEVGDDRNDSVVKSR